MVLILIFTMGLTSLLGSVVLTFIFSVDVWSHPQFRDTIPNGHQVPVPQCDISLLSMLGNRFFGQFDQTVGHSFPPRFNNAPLNDFGLDYYVNGGNWTVLCPLDSDGDGLINGKELGDENCTWTKGSTAAGTAISHPGFHNDCSMLYASFL